jgi:hypothetical protein
VGLAAGDFTGSGRPSDVAVVDRSAHAINLLPADGQGGFANPQAALSFSTSDGTTVNPQPGVVVAGQFYADSTVYDLAVLMQDVNGVQDENEVWIYSPDGRGGFSHTASIPVGPATTGLTLVRGSQPGQNQLLVGDAFGDVLTLISDGQGSFYFPPPPGSGVSLDVASGVVGGQPGALVSNASTGTVTLQTPAADGTQFSNQVQALQTSVPLAQVNPAAVQWAPLDGPNAPLDAVVVNSASNDVLIYRKSADGTYQPSKPIFVGTDPVSVTVVGINGQPNLRGDKGDGTPPDLLVADKGSNQVSVVFGKYDGNGNWTGTAGPRLNSGGVGPVLAVAVPGAGGAANPDVVAVNGQSLAGGPGGSVVQIPGVGQGFFNDQNLSPINLTSPVPGPPVFVQSSGQMAFLNGGQLDTFSLNGLGLVQPVPLSAPVDAVAAAGGDLLVALAGDNVEQLQPDGAGGFSAGQDFTPLDHGLAADEQAAALAELPNSDEVLVATADGRYVLVFGPAPNAPPPSGPDVGPPPTGPAVPEAMPAEGASLVLLITFQVPSLPEGGEAAAGPEGSSAGQAAGAAEGAPVPAHGGEAAAAPAPGGAGGVPGAQEVARADDPVQPPVDDGLRDQEAPPPPEVPLDGTPAPEPAVAKAWARALAALWHDAPGLPAAAALPLGPTTPAAAEARLPSQTSAPLRQDPATEVITMEPAALPPDAAAAEVIPEFAPAPALAPGRQARPLPAGSGESPSVYAAALAAAGLAAWPPELLRPAGPADVPRPAGRRDPRRRKGRPAP